MICNKCGESNIDGAEICSKCGNELTEEAIKVEEVNQPEEYKVTDLQSEGSTEDKEINDIPEESELEAEDSLETDEEGIDYEEESDENLKEESDDDEELETITFGGLLRKYWKVVTAAAIVVLIALIVIFNKPIFYNTSFTTAKILKNVNEGAAVGLAKISYMFNKTDANRDFIDNTSIDYAEKLLNTNINRALDVANSGFKSTGSEDLRVFIENAKDLNNYAKTYGSPYVGTIDGEKITVTEFKVFLYSVKYQILQNANLPSSASAEKDFWSSKMPDGTVVSDFAKEQAFTNLKQFKIQLIKARQEGCVVAKKDLDKEFSTLDTQIVQSFGAGETGKKAFLNEIGVSVDQFKAVTRDRLLTTAFCTKETDKTKAQPADVLKSDYEKVKDSVDSVTVTHVLFCTSDPNTGKAYSTAKQAVAKKNADNILAKAKAGQDITALAKKYSEDPSVKDNNGEYTFKKGQMVPQFEDWAFKAKIGDIGVVKSDYGYHVIKLTKRSAYKDAVKDDIASAMLTYNMGIWEKEKTYDINKDKAVIDKISLA